MAKAFFTPDAARRIVAATLKVEGQARDLGTPTKGYRGDDGNTVFFRLESQLYPCGTASAYMVTLRSAGAAPTGSASTDKSCPTAGEAIDQSYAHTIRDLNHAVKAHNVILGISRTAPLERYTIVECDHLAPTDPGQVPFWRLLRVIRCDCSGATDPQTIEVVTDVYCENGTIKVRKTKIEARVVP